MKLVQHALNGNAIAFVQGVSDTGAAGTTPEVLPAFGTNVAVGDLIVVLCGGDGGVTGLATGVTDNLGNTYTRVPGFDIANGAGTLNLDCFYAVVTVAGACTITCAFDDLNENGVFVAQHFNGFVGTATLDQIKRQENASSTTCTSGASPSTTVANEVVIGLGIHASTVSAFSLGSGYTNLTQASVAARQAAMESKIVSSTGAQTATFTIAAARVNIGGLVTFYDAGGGAATNQVTMNRPLARLTKKPYRGAATRPAPFAPASREFSRTNRY